MSMDDLYLDVTALPEVPWEDGVTKMLTVLPEFALTDGQPGPPGITPLFWTGTQAEFDALGDYDDDTLYIIRG